MSLPENINPSITPPIGSEFQDGDPIIVKWNDPSISSGTEFIPCDYFVNFSDAQSWSLRMSFSVGPYPNIPDNLKFYVVGNSTFSNLGLEFEANIDLSGGGTVENGVDTSCLIKPPGNANSAPGQARPLIYTINEDFSQELFIQIREANNTPVPNSKWYIGSAPSGYPQSFSFDILSLTSAIYNFSFTYNSINYDISFSVYITQCVPYSTSPGPNSSTLNSIANIAYCPHPYTGGQVGCIDISNNFPYQDKNTLTPWFGSKPTTNITKIYSNPWPPPFPSNFSPCLSTGAERQIIFTQSDYISINFNYTYYIYVQQVYNNSKYYPCNSESVKCVCSSSTNNINNSSNIPPFTSILNGWGAIQRKTNFSNVNCQGKYTFRCNWIRPGRLINMQPEAGKPLPYKYMDEMGSLLAKNRLRSNMIQNATAAGKNTLVFISRPTNCSEPKKCGVAPICNLSTGNKNPNFINRY